MYMILSQLESRDAQIAKSKLWCSSKRHKLWNQSVFLYVMVLSCMFVCLLLLQSCLILCNLRACNLPGSSVHGIFQARYWSGLPHPPPGHLPDPGIKLVFLVSPALAGRFFTTGATWGALDMEILKVSTSKNSCADKKPSTYMNNILEK